MVHDDKTAVEAIILVLKENGIEVFQPEKLKSEGIQKIFEELNPKFVKD